MNLVSAVLCLLAAAPLTPGDHTRTLQHGGRTRSYVVHVPPKYDAAAHAGRAGLSWGADGRRDDKPLHRTE